MRKTYWTIAIIATILMIVLVWPIGIGIAILLFYVIPKEEKKNRKNYNDLAMERETAEINAELLDILLSVKQQKGKSDKTE